MKSKAEILRAYVALSIEASLKEANRLEQGGDRDPSLCGLIAITESLGWVLEHPPQLAVQGQSLASYIQESIDIAEDGWDMESAMEAVGAYCGP